MRRHTIKALYFGERSEVPAYFKKYDSSFINTLGMNPYVMTFKKDDKKCVIQFWNVNMSDKFESLRDDFTRGSSFIVINNVAEEEILKKLDLNIPVKIRKESVAEAYSKGKIDYFPISADLEEIISKLF